MLCVFETELLRWLQLFACASPVGQERPATLCVFETELLYLAMAVRWCLPPLGRSDRLRRVGLDLSYYGASSFVRVRATVFSYSCYQRLPPFTP